MSVERVRVNGAELAYTVRGNGTPLVMIHGGQGDQRAFAEFASLCAAGDLRVLTFDQRGSGLSEKPDMEYSTAMLADDTAALMDRVDFPSAHIFGVSLGGMIAQELALGHPGRVRSLVLGCTSARRSRERHPEESAVLAAYSPRPMSAEERGAALAYAIFSKAYLEQHPEVISAMMEYRLEQPVDLVAQRHRRKAFDEHDTYDRLAAITCPTLVITGSEDAFFPGEDWRVLAERIPGALLEIIEPSGHCFWMERPERSRDALFRFLFNASSTSESRPRASRP